MLKGSSSRQAGSLLQLLHQLPAVESVQEIDITGTAVQNLNRQLCAVAHVNTCAALIRIAAIF